MRDTRSNKFPFPLVLRGNVGVGVEPRIVVENPHPIPPPRHQGRGKESLRKASCDTGAQMNVGTLSAGSNWA